MTEKLTPFGLHKKKWKDGCGSSYCEGTKVCISRGKIPANVVFIGEAPGESEDTIGMPFVGPAGDLLDKIIDKAFSHFPDPACRPRILFTNMVGCIPRDEEEGKLKEPDHDQIQQCAPRLQELIMLADGKDPGMAARLKGSDKAKYLSKLGSIKLLVKVGKVADDYTDPKMMHGIRFHRSIESVAIKHPAAIIRSNIAQRGLDVQRCVLTLISSWSEYLESVNK